MNIIFAGTPSFAVPSLQTLIHHKNFTVRAIITQPDKPVGRGQQVSQTPIKQLGLEHSIPVFDQSINTLQETIEQIKPDVLVVVAYGELIKNHILKIPRLGAVNIHSSLLPRYRGASPIQAALLNGDKKTGITLMHLSEELDAGPVITQKSLTIEKEDTAGTLHDRLGIVGARLLEETLERARITQSLPKSPQDETRVTHTKKITTNDAEIHRSESAEHIERKIRAYNPWPGAFIKLPTPGGKELRLKIFAAEIKKGVSDDTPDTTPFFSILEHEPALNSQDNKLVILTDVQPEGKKRMSGQEFIRGYMK